MSFHGNLGMVKLLVEMYGNAEAKDENQQTPLHIACTKGYTDIVEYLIIISVVVIKRSEITNRLPHSLPLV